jgi:hypothetical protein
MSYFAKKGKGVRKRMSEAALRQRREAARRPRPKKYRHARKAQTDTPSVPIAPTACGTDTPSVANRRECLHKDTIITNTKPGSMHYKQEICVTCGRWMRWLPRPLTQ